MKKTTLIANYVICLIFYINTFDIIVLIQMMEQESFSFWAANFFAIYSNTSNIIFLIYTYVGSIESEIKRAY